MKRISIDILACPKCLGGLGLKDHISENGEIISGILYCKDCDLTFNIESEVAILGMDREHAKERFSEIHGENEWMITANQIQTHVDFAKGSSQAGERIIKKILQKIGKVPAGKNLRVLDLGAGLGCLQSWQFSQYGFDAFALDLCPEFMLASDIVAKDARIQRIISDCAILPFKDRSFDIVFCKELIHHISDPYNLLNEIYRITSDNGLIVIREPCSSILRNKKKLEKIDVAKHVGITHQYYNYFDYINFAKAVADNVEVDGDITILDPSVYPVLHSIQKPIITIGEMFPYGNIFVKLQLIFINGSVNILCFKKSTYNGKLSKRDVIPINIKEINDQQIAFYREKLVPKLYEVFTSVHKELNA